MIEIKEVKTRKQKKEFINFPLKLYKNNPYFVPPLYGDEMKIFKKSYVYNDTCESVFFNAYRNRKIVGRISGIIQKAANAKNSERRVRFTRFDALDEQEIADKLFEAVEKWAIEKNMDTVCGPLGYSDLEREGLLIEGFDELSTFEEQYNYPYYQKLIENLGYTKEVDWVERKIYAPDVYDEKLEKVSNMMLKKYNLKFAEFKSTKELLNRYAGQLFSLLDESYAHLYGTVPFTDRMKKMTLDNFKLLINKDNVGVIIDENDNVVSFAVCIPSLAKAVQKSGGRLTIPTIFRLLKAIKKPRIIDFCLFGVRAEYANKGVSSAITAYAMKLLFNPNIEYAETNLNLEDNHNIINQWKRFKTIQHKRRRAFVKKLCIHPEDAS